MIKDVSDWITRSLLQLNLFRTWWIMLSSPSLGQIFGNQLCLVQDVLHDHHQSVVSTTTVLHEYNSIAHFIYVFTVVLVTLGLHSALKFLVYPSFTQTLKRFVAVFTFFSLLLSARRKFSLSIILVFFSADSLILLYPSQAVLFTFHSICHSSLLYILFASSVFHYSRWISSTFFL